jgi:hypothetical protein
MKPAPNKASMLRGEAVKRLRRTDALPPIRSQETKPDAEHRLPTGACPHAEQDSSTAFDALQL